MRRLNHFLLAAVVLPACSSFAAPGVTGVAQAEPLMRLAQAPSPEELKKKKEQQQQPRPGGPPPGAQPSRPPGPPAQAPAAPPAQRPVQSAPPPAAPHPAQVPPPQPQRPTTQAPPAPPPPGQPPHAPAQNAPPTTAPLQRPAQGTPPQPPTTPTAPLQRPAQGGPPPGAPGAPGAPQHPAQGNVPPPPGTPGAPQRPAQGNVPPPPGAPGAPGVPPQRPAQGNVPPPPGAPAGAPPQRPAQGGPPPGALPPPPAPTAAQTPLRPVGPGGAAAGIAPQTAQGKPVLRVDGLRAERHETREGDRTIIREPDRIIVRENDGHAFIRHNEVDRFRFNALNVRVERRGNDNVTIVDRPGGERIVTVLAPDGRLMRRSRVFPDGREVIIIDERGPPVASVFVTLPPPVIRIPRERYIVEAKVATPAMIYDTLMAPPVEPIDQPYTLDQVRYSYSLRERMPSIDIDTINFDSGSWEVAPDQVDRLSVIAEAISKAVARNPREVFLVEGHTDAVGNDVDNLSLSDRRAETVGLVLSDKFQVPPENLVTQGYGEQYLKIPSQGPERRNRRVTVRRITPLLAGGTS